MFRNRLSYAVALALVLFASSAGAASPATKCAAAKLKIAGKYGACRLKAEAKAVKTGDPVDYSKCDIAFADKWALVETNGAGECPTNGDLAARQAELTADADRATWRLSGDPRFADNADGTITDPLTGLMWEKKTELNNTVNLPNPHDADNHYLWAGTCSSLPSKQCQPSAAAAALCAANAEGTTGCAQCSGGEGTCSAATTVWSWSVDLNTSSFAGHSDWRVPKLTELQTIVDYSDATVPIVNAAFHGASCGGGCTNISSPACSCTSANTFYWSASTYVPIPNNAWFVYFGDGTIFQAARPTSYNARAVRGGS